MTTRVIATLAIAACLISLLGTAAHAGVMVQPTSASTDMGQLFPANNTRNQSGLSTGYTSLVTDFDSYIATNPKASAGPTTVWASTQAVRSGNFDFALGGTYSLSAMAIWNAFQDPSSIRQFTLLLDDNSSFTSPDNMGTFTASNSLGSGGDTYAQVFTFPQTSASFARLQILNTWSGSSYSTAVNEVAFGVYPVAVPEPSTCVMALAGLACGGFSMWRRRRRT